MPEVPPDAPPLPAPALGVPAPAGSPYKGLIPYSEQDADFFFGRDRERRIIATNLLASRLTVLYGESGVGKTSVLRAGVVHDLRQQARAAMAERGSPGFVVVEFATWRDDPLEGLAAAIEQSVRLLLGDAAPSPPAVTKPFDALLQGWAEQLDSELLLILDQFEEFFLYHGADEGDGSFAAEFARAVNRRDLRANFLISIREDTIAKLDRFKGKIPNQLLFGNYLTVQHLDRAAGREAIVRPIERYNSSISDVRAISVEPALVDRVLSEVERGQLVVGQVGQGTVAESTTADARIETPYLQLVMSRLWDEEQAAGSRVLRLATLERLGGAERIVRTHLDDAMSALSPESRDLAARVLRFLVTPGGTKIALSADDLAEFAGVPSAELEPLLDSLARRPALVLRPVAPPPGETTTRYEIFHDVLAAAILDWRARYQESRRRLEAEAELDRERRDSAAKLAAARRRVRQIAAAGVVVVAATVIAVGLAFTALEQKNQADQARTAADQARAAADQARTTAEQEKTAADQARATAEQEKTAADQARATAEQEKTAADQARAAADAAKAMAEDQKNAATAEAFVEHALSALATDPQAGLHYALDAIQLEPASASAQNALRLALSRSRVRAVLRDNTDVVWAASFSSDGSRVVTASSDHTARIADASTGQTIAVLAGHSGIVLDAAFSPDGRRVVTTSEDETAQVWDAKTGQSLFAPLKHDNFVHLARSDLETPGGRYIATGAFSVDGSSVVTSAGRSAWIWDLDTGKLVRKLVHPSDVIVFNSAFSADGKLVVTASDDGIARIWDAASGKLRFALDNDTDWVNMATFSPDGTLVACANQDGSVGLWNVSTGTLNGYRTDHSGEVQTVAFSADGTQLVTAGEKTAYVLAIAPKTTSDAATRVATIRAHASWIDSAQFSPDGRYVVTANQDGSARVVDAATANELFALKGHTNIVWTARFSPRGDRVVTASEDHTARIWSVDTGVALRGHTSPVNTVAFNTQGSLVATASLDETAAIWNARTGEIVHRLEGAHAANGLHPFGSAMFSPDGKQLLTAQESGGVTFWDVTSGGQVGTCCKHGGWWAEAAAFALGRADRVIVRYDDSTVHAWDLSGDAAGNDIHTFDQGRIYAFALDRDGRTLVTVGRDDKMARLWNADTFAPIGAWHLDLVNSIEFSPDGQRLVTAGQDGIVRIWNAADGGLVAHLPASESPVMVATFSLDGSWILGGEASGTTRIWDSEGHLLADLPMQADSINSLATTADGRIAAASDDDSAKIFKCSICGSLAEVLAQANTQAAVYDPSSAPSH